MSTSISTCSFQRAGGGDVRSQSALWFPAFQHVQIPSFDEVSVEQLVAAISPGEIPKANSMVRQNIRQPTILICTHGGRDERCGILGPLLVEEFRKQLELPVNASRSVTGEPFSADSFNVAGISHVGGHKWAGNVIIYIPPEYQIKDQNENVAVSPLAGKGVWYGRVEPKHVDGIITETIFGGRIISDMFRGGIDANGNALRI
jgi:(2Fe-2S) ferredoxin